MQKQSKVIIADTSCFILLDKIDSFNILRELFGEVNTTKEVLVEFGKQLPQWVKIEVVSNVTKQLLLEVEVDKGEASAIALALEKANCLIILDDFKARKLVKKNWIYDLLVH